MLCGVPLTFNQPAMGQAETIGIDVKLRTGGALTGLVIDHTDHGVVVAADGTPYVFSWDEIETGSAYVAKRDLLALARGGIAGLTASDRFELGLFALSRERNDLAAADFKIATRLDSSYEVRVRRAFEEFRSRPRPAQAGDDPILDRLEISADAELSGSGLADSLGEALCGGTAGQEGGRAVLSTDPAARTRAMEVYRIFGERVRDTTCKDLAVIETEHFLIFTDWEKHKREQLARWCESVYSALARQLGIDPPENVFLAKCPVFCWRSKARFWRFARYFDGFESKEALGYSRSIERNGHVHVVVLRDGSSEYDYGRFACTLAHECTHAFLHRLYSTRLIPHWVNEGYADLVAERVLGDRCPNAENAELFARQHVRYDWAIGDMLRSAGPIPVHEYALAHSVVAYLETEDTARFARFIEGLKGGGTTAESLSAAYDGLTMEGLERNWRDFVRRSDSTAGQ